MAFEVFEVGNKVTAAIEVRNSSGALTSLGTAPTCTITLPDGTTASATVTTTATGCYSAVYTTTQAGRHVRTWNSVSQTNSDDFPVTDVFNVVSATPASIISLDEARAALNWPDTDTDNNEELRSFLDAATEVVEDLVGPVVTRTYTEQHTSGGGAIALNHYPVLAVSSFVEYTPAAITWTKADNPAAAVGNQFTINTANGVIRARWGASFAGECWVTYTAGRAVTPPAIREACVEIVKARWQQSQQGNARPDLGGVQITGVSGKTYVVPYLAEALLKPYMQAGGFA